MTRDCRRAEVALHGIGADLCQRWVGASRASPPHVVAGHAALGGRAAHGALAHQLEHHRRLWDQHEQRPEGPVGIAPARNVVVDAVGLELCHVPVEASVGPKHRRVRCPGAHVGIGVVGGPVADRLGDGTLQLRLRRATVGCRARVILASGIRAVNPEALRRPEAAGAGLLERDARLDAAGGVAVRGRGTNRSEQSSSASSTGRYLISQGYALVAAFLEHAYVDLPMRLPAAAKVEGVLAPRNSSVETGNMF
eukprot:1591481-Prymnesium_polylepis.2